MTDHQYFFWFTSNGGILRTCFANETAAVKATLGRDTIGFITPVNGFDHLTRLHLALIQDLYAKQNDTIKP